MTPHIVIFGSGFKKKDKKLYIAIVIITEVNYKRIGLYTFDNDAHSMRKPPTNLPTNQSSSSLNDPHPPFLSVPYLRPLQAAVVQPSRQPVLLQDQEGPAPRRNRVFARKSEYRTLVSSRCRAKLRQGPFLPVAAAERQRGIFAPSESARRIEIR